MSFRRIYNEIREMLLTTALDPAMARDIVRKAGLKSGAGSGDDGTTLTDQLLSPPASDSHPHRPRRRVQNGLAWPYAGYAGTPDGDTYWDEGVSISGQIIFDGTLHIDQTLNTVHDANLDIGRLADSQVRWSSMYFPGFSDHRINVGAYLEPHISGGPIRAGRAWVGGETLYDPFPYPGCYFWADTSEAYVTPVFGQSFTGNAASPYETIDDLPTGPMILRCWASSDGGSTWDAPWPPRTPVGGVSNPGSAYWAQYLGPSGSTPGPTDDGYISPLPEQLKDEFRADDTLFKFTLATPDPNDWLQFRFLGLYVLGFRPED